MRQANKGARICLEEWEGIAVDAVGDVIEFWGFKRNLGRVWALLYLYSQPLSAAEVRGALGLSKGGVSMLLGDLEHWKVVVRVRDKGEIAWRYRAETDVLKMARRVLEEREYILMKRVCSDFEQAKSLALALGDAPKEKLERLANMAVLAERTAKLVQLLMKTPQLDLRSVFKALASKVAAKGRSLMTG
ncbi:MAG: transcriptional regulator [Proteobacteria bacterium]|nr:transcriptional regulator [Cystobacterineae bacterium]MCL2259599.1 transcriptional regulator [Cystobacterineae bacterium]MCL2313921.1 transcriptional regulator [Pseudomonadota bacterium]